MMPEQEKVNEIVKKGEEALFQGDYKKAIELLKQSLATDPDNHDSLYILGIIYMRMNEPEQAVQAFRKIVQSNPAFPQINHIKTMLGYVYSMTGNFVQAIEILNEVLEQESQNIHALSTLGYIHFQKKEYDQSIDKYKKVLEIAPDNYNALNSLGFTLIESGFDIKKGIEECKKALSLSPNNPSIMDSIGWGYYKLGEEEQAVEYLRQAFEIAPDNLSIKRHIREIINI